MRGGRKTVCTTESKRDSEHINIWIPQKNEIERLLQDILDKLKSAKNISDIEEWIDDALVSLECHVSNRASIERDEISEA